MGTQAGRRQGSRNTERTDGPPQAAGGGEGRRRGVPGGAGASPLRAESPASLPSQPRRASPPQLGGSLAVLLPFLPTRSQGGL